MAYRLPRAGDSRVSGPLTTGEAETLLTAIAETAIRMGHGANMRYYVAKFGSSHAVYRRRD